MFWERFELLCKESQQKINSVMADIGLSPATATKWKNGAIPNGSALQKLAHYFGVSTDYLLGLTDNPDPITMVAASHATNPFGKLSDDELAALEAYLDIYRKNKQ